MTFSVYQIVFAALIVAALYGGRPHWRISLAIVGNFIASAAISKLGLAASESLIWTGIADSFTVALLLGLTARGNIAAACYAAMIMLYPLAHWLEWSNDTLYSCIEVLGALALAVIGGLDSGSRRIYRALRARFGRDGAAYHRGHNGVAQRVIVPLVSRGVERR